MEERIQKLNILLKAICDINQLIVRERNRSVIYQKICELLALTGLFNLVWVGLKSEKNFGVVPIAKAGKSVGYLDNIKITWDESPAGMCPTGLAFKTKLPQSVPDFFTNENFKVWWEDAKQYNLESSMSLPLIVDGEVKATLNVYSSTVNAFGVDEINLLAEVAEDISFGLYSIENEEKLRNSEQMYRALAEAAHDIIYIIGKDWRVEFINSFAAKYLKHPPEEIIGKKHEELFPKEVADRHKINLQKIFDFGKSLYFEALDVLGDKKIFLGSWLSPIFDEEGKVKSVLGISRDLTASKEMELKLQQSEENYHNIAELNPDGLLVCDGIKILLVNKAALKMLGAEDENQIVGQALLNFIHPDNRDFIKQCLESVRMEKSSDVSFVEEKIVRLDGSTLLVEAGMASINFEGSKAFQVIIRDLTERKKKEEERNRQIEEIEKLNQYMLGRELKMKELKKEIELLKKKCA